MQRRAFLGAASAFGLAALIGCDAATTDDSEILVWGRRGLDPGRFQKPRAITINDRDELFIVDMTGRIQVFDLDGNLLRFWRTPEVKNGKPVGLSISHDGLVVVSDTHYHRVLFYEPDGTLIPDKTIGGENGRGPGQFGFLTETVQDSKHHFYVAEYGDYDRIQKFSPHGQYMTEWGGHGSEPGKFLRPQALAIDKHDRLWVADASNHRIQVFDVSRQQVELVTAWGDPGHAPGQMRYPYDIDFDHQGNVIVCEFGNHRIQKFTTDGESLGVWGSPGRAVGQLHQPWDLCIDRHQRIHVLDSYNHRVQRFRWPTSG